MDSDRDSNESVDPNFLLDDTCSSNTDYSTAESDIEEEHDPMKFGDWTVLREFFSDQRQLTLKEYESELDFLQALNIEDFSSPSLSKVSCTKQLWGQ